MCGIAGAIGVEPDQVEVAARNMLAAVLHRGPDGHGMELVTDASGLAAAIAHSRLAILDLSEDGRQPMRDRSVDFAQSPNWIVFNGEIFNYRAIQTELACTNWPCRTRTDTEVILNAYRVWGERCVEKFRGMFAWCVLDVQQGQAWLCRDRLGIKPLYVYRPQGGGLIFASEVRAILAVGPELIAPKLSSDAIESFLAQGAVFGDRSIVEGIELLPAGHSLVVDWKGNTLRQGPYWEAPRNLERTSEQVPMRDRMECHFGPTEVDMSSTKGSKTLKNHRRSAPQGDRASSVRELGIRIRDAVALRLISDVPLGLFLSGGIDSCALATLAMEVSDTKLQTLSVRFDAKEFDESEIAARVAKELGTEHSVVDLSGEMVLDELDSVLDAVDQPTVDGFNTFFVSRAAKRAGLTVALSGLGGDELFGGYASFRDVPRGGTAQKMSNWLGPGRQWLSHCCSWLPFRSSYKASELLIRPHSPVHGYLLRRELFFPKERRQLLPLPARSCPQSGIERETLAGFQSATVDDDAINEISHMELLGYMRSMLLRDADVFSMVNQLELRVPLLDHKVVEFALSLPGVWKRPDPRPKPLLIDAVGPRLPKFIQHLPKRGFTFPWKPWLLGPLCSRVDAIVNDAPFWESLGFIPGSPARIWQRFREGDGRIAALQILAFLVLHRYVQKLSLTA